MIYRDLKHVGFRVLMSTELLAIVKSDGLYECLNFVQQNRSSLFDQPRFFAQQGKSETEF